MTIEQYIKTNPEFILFQEHTLDFTEPDNGEEAKNNLLYVLANYNDLKPNNLLEAISIVIRSYYMNTIDWD